MAFDELTHQPRRGSDVEQWLRRKRDELTTEDGDRSVHWYTLDALLDDYRLHADTGTPLDRDTPDFLGNPDA